MNDVNKSESNLLRSNVTIWMQVKLGDCKKATFNSRFLASKQISVELKTYLCIYSFIQRVMKSSSFETKVNSCWLQETHSEKERSMHRNQTVVDALIKTYSRCNDNVVKGEGYYEWDNKCRSLKRNKDQRT